MELFFVLQNEGKAINFIIFWRSTMAISAESVQAELVDLQLRIEELAFDRHPNIPYARELRRVRQKQATGQPLTSSEQETLDGSVGKFWEINVLESSSMDWFY